MPRDMPFTIPAKSDEAFPFSSGASTVSRRTLLAGVAAVAAGAVLGPRSAYPGMTPSASAGAQAAAEPAPRLPTPQFQEAFARIVGSGTPVEGLMTLEMPEDAENGNIVPYKISVDSPMTEEDYIAEVHLLSTQNPQAVVATFHFTPLSGRAAVAGRMRLARTQEVVAVALTSRNTLIAARAEVEVGIGGCGTE